ncbi:conserved hypothetical protein [Aspergillus terreus NIH2624]|uniref:RRM domain-containing protein n=1 Tax=Aspergillus terreus (strain NIH 2624 / FGSC A1156) TaxID=341663 RepID=Q0CDG3_ASPTN|nr:uncharacterized protein ATEG_08271 [Aspergillus terreus NIH2624]EAU31444.1 conserved hypothetical protein [Aspergillus terreus NIH2624]
MSNMDRSLDEIIAERPQQQRQNRGRRPQGRRNDGVKKSHREDRVDLDLDWVHDKYEDDRDSAFELHPTASGRLCFNTALSTPDPCPSPTPRRSLFPLGGYDLFSRIGPVSNLTLVYDRAGRSEGVAFVTYSRVSDARTAISEFDGANAKGQPIRITLVSTGGGRRDRNPFDNVERPRGSLFDRVERPRNARSLSPGGSDGEGGSRRRRGGGGGRRAGGGGGRYRRSDVSKPPPDHIDRYVPGERSPGPRASSGRRQGGGGGDGRRMVNGRPRKTQEELDAEMDDYWLCDAALSATRAIPEQPPQVAPASTAAAGDDDIDMIE